MTSLPRALILAGFILLLPLVAFADDPCDQFPHIRPLDKDLYYLVALGLNNSPSFRVLVDRLSTSDVVVYIRWSRTLRAGLSGQLTFLGATAGIRYVVVSLEADRLPERTIATLGHELMHAVEIAETPAIVSESTLGVAYERIGRSTRVPLGVSYDTAAAIEIGRQVWREVQRNSIAQGE